MPIESRTSRTPSPYSDTFSLAALPHKRLSRPARLPKHQQVARSPFVRISERRGVALDVECSVVFGFRTTRRRVARRSETTAEKHATLTLTRTTCNLYFWRGSTRHDGSRPPGGYPRTQLDASTRVGEVFCLGSSRRLCFFARCSKWHDSFDVSKWLRGLPSLSR